jgi:hypothetical protein
MENPLASFIYYKDDNSRGRDILKQKGDADSSLKRGLSSIVDSIKRIRIAAGGTTGRDFERYDDFERIDVDGSKIYVTSDPEETYVCNTKFEPHIPSPTRRETLVDMNGNKFEPSPVVGELYNPDSATSVIEKVDPFMDGFLDTKDSFADVKGICTDPVEPYRAGGAADEDVDVSDLFTGPFGFGIEPAKKKEEPKVKKDEPKVTETPVVVPELPGKVDAPVDVPEVPEAPETPAVDAPVDVPETPVVVPELPGKVEAPVDKPVTSVGALGVKSAPEAIKADDDDYDDEVITFENGNKPGISTADGPDKIVDPEIGITKKALEDQDAALTKAVEDIVANVGDDSGEKIVAVDGVTARPEDMVEHKIEGAVVIDSSTQKIVFDTVKPEVVKGSVAVSETAVVPVVLPEVKKSELVPDAMPSKTETSDIPNRVMKTKKAKTSDGKSKKYYMNDCYKSLSEPTTHRPLRFTGGNLVDTEVPARPPRRESRKKAVSEYTLTKDVEEKKEERQTLNSIMARSVEEPKLVVPKARRLVLQPIKIEDEVEDVMRLSVPNFDAEDFGEEDFASCPEDGIEEILFESESKNDCQVVFSFGGDGYGDEGITFYFGH